MGAAGHSRRFDEVDECTNLDAMRLLTCVATVVVILAIRLIVLTRVYSRAVDAIALRLAVPSLVEPIETFGPLAARADPPNHVRTIALF